jgi:hypothetical protein
VDPFSLDLDPDPAPGFLVNTDPGSRLLMTKNFAKFPTAFFLCLYVGFQATAIEREHIQRFKT